MIASSHLKIPQNHSTGFHFTEQKGPTGSPNSADDAPLRREKTSGPSTKPRNTIHKPASLLRLPLLLISPHPSITCFCTFEPLLPVPNYSSVLPSLRTCPNAISQGTSASSPTHILLLASPPVSTQTFPLNSSLKRSLGNMSSCKTLRLKHSKCIFSQQHFLPNY